MNQPKKIINPYNKYIFSTKVSLFISIIALLITVLAVSMVWHNLKYIGNLKSQLSDRSTGMHQALSTTQRSLDNLSQQLQQQAKVENRLQQLATHSHENNQTTLINQALSLLQLVQLQLTTQVNTATSIVLLTQTNHALSQLSNSLSAPYEKKVSRIVTELSSAKDLDVTAQIQQLNTLREKVVALLFIPEEKQVEPTPAQTNQSDPQWKRAYEDMSQYVDHLIAVQYHTVPKRPLANAYQENAFKQYLFLKISEAEWAILNNNNSLFHQALDDCSQQISAIISNPKQQHELLALISTLQHTQFGYDRSHIINQVDDIITDLSHTQGKTTASTPTKTPAKTITPNKAPSNQPDAKTQPNVSVEI